MSNPVMCIYEKIEQGLAMKEIDPCTPRWDMEGQANCPDDGMRFGIGFCIGQILGVSPRNNGRATFEIWRMSSSMHHGCYQHCRFEYHEFHKRQV